ncbi:hypothetical protein HSBAA_40140 [Vreelandella sulfidaeris]|uniref:Uncharacterized protein n=1 Tax=Vreelandella sulfidaeris TaxID=115553 RepID=A0A455UEC9_9GAMM|nr:hypothetical protein HSBAA_40140 [Halomonas sulfidaeris]
MSPSGGRPSRPFKTIGLIGRLGSDKVLDSLQRLVTYLVTHEYSVLVEDRTATALPHHGQPEASRRMLGSCAIWSLWSAAMAAYWAQRVRFAEAGHSFWELTGVAWVFTDISPDELETRVAEVLAGEFEIEQRFCLTRCFTAMVSR